MASFRTGFKIVGEISLKQGLGRIRSFSEDRRGGQWLPEDQWAVRQPGSTCPDPCEKPKKPPKPSKSWLSICRDPPKEIECDVRHNNCPPPPKEGGAPWYSLENFIPKKKPSEKIPPLGSCREELKRQEAGEEDEEVCENIQDKTLNICPNPEPSDCCMPKPEPCPAPVVSLSCPLPKELDISLWCERPCTDTSKIPIPCQSDRLPYDEFRPQKIWKPAPFSLPVKVAPMATPLHCTDNVAYAEFKQVEVPKPLYTRYKSVELTSKSMLFCPKEVQCSGDELQHIKSLPPSPLAMTFIDTCDPPKVNKKEMKCPEKPVLEAASCKPVKIKKAPKYTFKPKPTKLIEKVVKKVVCPQHKISDFESREKDENEKQKEKQDSTSEPPKVITGTLTDEPQTFEREQQVANTPPSWMYAICKPGAQKTPLVPCKEEPPTEPKDWCEETDGLKFYDGQDENITPKPPPDPCLAQKKEPEPKPKPKPEPAEPEKPEPVEEPVVFTAFRNRFVLMPEEYNIKCSRQPESGDLSDNSQSFEKYIELKTASTSKCSKSYPPMKENILYDLQRLCPNPPLDPSKINAPSIKPPAPECPRLPRFYRSYSTFQPSNLGKLKAFELCKVQRRTECEDTSGKCKARPLIPRPKECPEPPPKPDCAEITLPCCPKARIPPDCDAKKPIPLCKKRLPPKPAFSECSKDPLPCPRMTECNCWEKKKK